MAPEEKLLLEIIKGKASEKSYKGIDWKEFTELSGYHRIIPFVNENIGKTLVPEKASEKLKEKSREIALRNLILDRELKELAGELEKQGIKFIVFKGMALNNILWCLCGVPVSSLPTIIRTGI